MREPYSRVHYDMKVEAGRIAGTRPIEGAVIEVFLGEDGRARTMFRGHQAPFCHAPDQGPNAFKGAGGTEDLYD